MNEPLTSEEITATNEANQQYLTSQPGEINQQSTKPQPQKRHSKLLPLLLGIIFLLVLIVGGLSVYLYLNTNQISLAPIQTAEPTIQPMAVAIPTPSPTSSPSPSATASPTAQLTPTDYPPVYRLKMTQTAVMPEQAYAEVVKEVFVPLLFGKKIQTRISFDTSKYSLYGEDVAMKTKGFGWFDAYNSELYIVPLSAELPTKRSFQLNWVNGELSDEPGYLNPYIQDSKYCVQDIDCMVRYEGNAYGGFNKYHRFVQGVGGSGEYDADTLNAQGKPVQILSGLEEPGSCIPKITYASAQCINNACKGTGRTATTCP